MTEWSLLERYRVVSRSGEASWPSPLEPRPKAEGLYARSDLPFILNPHGVFDVDLNMFWSDAQVAVRASSTASLYAAHLARFLDFIWNARSTPEMRRTWRDVTHQDRAAYYHWRNSDENGPRVGPSTWNNETVAVSEFYRFQVSVGNLPSSPLRTRMTSGAAVAGRKKSPGERLTELRAPRRPKAPWLLPAEYSLWCNVGLRGYTSDGVRDPKFRGRQSARNAAFADLMYGTGLRLTEQSSLLREELEDYSQTQAFSKLDVSSAIAKNGTARFVLLSARVRRSIATYIATDRLGAIRRAQRLGTYDDYSQALVADNRGFFMLPSGRKVHVRDAMPHERRRLMIQTAEGLEPAALWLTEQGLPAKPNTWQGVFQEADRRLAKEGSSLRCHPHMLRHSWATITLAQLQRRYNLQRAGMLSGTAIGDPLNWISRRLGHSGIETTMIYIHNLSELETETILSMIPDRVDLVAIPDGHPGVTVDRSGLRL